MGRCITPTMTTETLLRTTTTEVAQTTKPPMTTIVGIAVPGSLLLLILLIAIGVGIYNGIRSSKNTGDYRILVIIPNGALPRLGNKLDQRGRLILYTTPRCTCALPRKSTLRLPMSVSPPKCVYDSPQMINHKHDYLNEVTPLLLFGRYRTWTSHRALCCR